MKKTALAVAIFGSLGFSAAHAATVSEFANGVLVPYVIDGGAGSQTAIGLTSCAAGTVYWTFFDVDSNHQADGTFTVTAHDQVNIIWGTTPQNGGSDIGGFVRPDLANVPGYMAFILDVPGNLDGALDSSDSPCLAGSAFQIDAQNNDVAFTPALPLDAYPLATGDFGDCSATGSAGNCVSDLRRMDASTIVRLNAGANYNDDLYLRYFVDGAAGGNDSTIYIWSTDDVTGTYTVDIYDLDQTFFSINLSLPNDELNIIDVEDGARVQNRPTEMTDGFIRWSVPDGIETPGDRVNGVVSWTVIESDAFGAAQSVMNPIRKLDDANANVFRVRVIDAPLGTVPGHSLEVTQ